MFIFICHCTRILLNKIHSVNVKYLIDYKVKFLIYTRTYSLKGRVRGGMIFVVFFRIHCMISFRFSVYIFYFVSFLSIHILFRFVVFRFSLYRDPIL